MKLVLLIRSLEIGGAERQMVALARRLVECGHQVHVLTFYPGGALRNDLEVAGVSVSSLGKRGRWDIFGFLLRLIRVLRQRKQGVLYSFLPTANLVGLLAAHLAGMKQVVWGVRASNIDLTQYDRLSRFEAWLAARLARYADDIICNSQAGALHHAKLGYPSSKMTVIPNGIDTIKFCFDVAGRSRVRLELGLEDSDLVIGLSARLDPMKGHETALQAMALLAPEVPNAKLVCVGAGPLFGSLCELSHKLQLEDRIIWAGERQDMPAMYSAFDISSSSSYGEGFSNSIAESMACERVCIVTDVGDSATIVGTCGWLVSARSPEALANAWRRALALSDAERTDMGRGARKRVVEKFSVDSMVKRTLQVVDE